MALASVVYDVLNRVALDAQLVKAGTYEVEVALAQLQLVHADDLLVFDRDLADYAFFMMKPYTVRGGRIVPQRRSSSRKLLPSRRRRKKITF